MRGFFHATMARPIKQSAKDAFDHFERITRSVPHLDYGRVYEDLLNFLLHGATRQLAHKEDMERIRREYTPAALNAMEKAAIAIAEMSHSFYDALGEIYECITSSKKSSALGQYFTPQPISKMMAAINDPLDTATGTLRIADFAGCGSGRMLMAMAERVELNRWRHFFFGVDLDNVCVKMATLNCTFNSIPAWIIHGNGLSDKVYGGYEIRLYWGEIEGVAGWIPVVKQFTPEEVKFVEQMRLNSFKGLENANNQRVAEMEKQRGEWQEKRDAIRERFRLMMEALGLPDKTEQQQPDATAVPSDEPTHEPTDEQTVAQPEPEPVQPPPTPAKRGRNAPPPNQTSLF